MYRSLLLVLLFVPSLSYACRTESTCFVPHVTWKLDRNSRIVDVCHNYPYGHWKYRECRSAAGRKFKELCSKYKDEQRSTQGVRRENARKKQLTYCVTFRP